MYRDKLYDSIGRHRKMSEVSDLKIYILVGVMILSAAAISAISVVAVFHKEALITVALSILVPLVAASLCLSSVSILLYIKVLKEKMSIANDVQGKVSTNLPGDTCESTHKETYIKNAGLEGYAGLEVKHTEEALALLYKQRLLPSHPSAEETFLQRALKASKVHGLTKRETEVLKLLLQGRNAERISQSLVISRHTAKTHIYNIYKKVGSTTQQELIDLFQERVYKTERGESCARSFARDLCTS